MHEVHKKKNPLSALMLEVPSLACLVYWLKILCSCSLFHEQTHKVGKPWLLPYRVSKDRGARLVGWLVGWFVTTALKLKRWSEVKI